MYDIFIIHLSAEDCVSCFHFLAIMNEVAMSMVEKNLQNQMLSPLGIGQEGKVGSYGTFTFSFFRNF